MMDKQRTRPEESSQSTEMRVESKAPFEEPKLEYVPPKLVKQASVEEVTAGFFGSFYP